MNINMVDIVDYNALHDVSDEALEEAGSNIVAAACTATSSPRCAWAPEAPSSMMVGAG